MSINPFYNYSGFSIPGSLARAESVAAEYQAVQAGFALLATEGVDTGTAGAYLVTTGGAPTGAYTDGQAVSFKATNANAGSSTINVNSVGVVALDRATGAALQAGDIILNNWYTAIYNSTFGAFTILNPVTQTTVPGTISAAAPTNKVKLVAAGGVSTAAVPIDATFAIDQSIAPTWTGQHTFSPTGGPTIFNGIASSPAISIIAATSGSGRDGLQIIGGASATDFVLRVLDQSDTKTYFQVTGDGAATIGYNGSGASVTIAASGSVTASGLVTANLGLTVSGASFVANGMTITTAGNVTIAAPSSGNTLIVTNSSAGGTGVFINHIQSASGGVLQFFNTTASAPSGYVGGGALIVGQGATDFPICSGNAASVQIGRAGGSALGTTFGAAGNVTIASPSSGNVLALTQNNASPGLLINGSNPEGLRIASTAANGSYLQLYNSATFLGFIGAAAQEFTSGAIGDLAIGCKASQQIVLGVNTTPYFTMASTGAIAIAAPSSGTSLTVTGIATGSNAGLVVNAGDAYYCAEFNNTASSTNFLLIKGDGGLIVGAPTGGSEGLGTINVASGYYINGVNALTIVQNSQAEPYTCVLGDLGKSVYCTTNGGTVTIPANSSVAYPLGAAITFVAASGVTLTIAITTDTLTLAGTATTGSRTLAANGVATALKVTSTSWVIAGSGLT
jgi:hypothetical protein